VQERWSLIREGRVDEAVDLALTYTPFPATVCGYLCPNLCMQGCTRQWAGMTPVDVSSLGKASIKATLPELPPLSGHRIAVIGGGPGGMSVAWQLRQHSHEAVLYDLEKKLGGKISSLVPRSRIVEQLKEDYDFVIIAVGAQKPRILPVPGKERMISALQFLKDSKADKAEVGKTVVIIGAGNVGCDAATEAHRLGAEDITLIDIQTPLSFGAEREAAEEIGAKFRWPCFTKQIIEEGVELTSGEVIPADTVIISIGDQPDLDFLPDTVKTSQGFIEVNDIYQTTDPQIFAIGDAVKLGLLTDAVGAGRQAARAINDILAGKRPRGDTHQVIDRSRIKLEYFDPRLQSFESIEQCSTECSSCGSCRDCGVCITICPRGAISKQEEGENGLEMVVDADLCCAGACPCGIWNIVENDPLG